MVVEPREKSVCLLKKPFQRLADGIPEQHEQLDKNIRFLGGHLLGFEDCGLTTELYGLNRLLGLIMESTLLGGAEQGAGHAPYIVGCGLTIVERLIVDPLQMAQAFIVA